MKKAILLFLILACAVAQQREERVVALPPPPDDTFAQIGDILAELAKITGLEIKHNVEYARIERDKVKPFLEERVKEVIKPEEIREEEAALKKFGFVPPDFDLKKTTIELLTEQAAAFYDFRKDKLFLIGAGNGMMQRTVLVHELAHALADQHFKLEQYIDESKHDDDSALARLAVMEGQATWLMSEYLLRQSGQSLKNSPLMLKMMANAGSVDMGQFPVFAKAPLYLRETLIFPYTKGMLFQHAVFVKMGRDAFAEVFRHPPASTQQILHPEKYLGRVKPHRPELPVVDHAADYREFTKGDIGELDHMILLKQYAGDEVSKNLAPEWRGGQYKILENKTDQRLVLAYASEWSSPEAARRFFENYRKVLKGKWKRLDIVRNAAGVISGTGDDGFFTVRLDGTRVTSVEGLPRAQP